MRYDFNAVLQPVGEYVPVQGHTSDESGLLAKV
jgi:hypothetical protein